jgi:hypothetical protein
LGHAEVVVVVPSFWLVVAETVWPLQVSEATLLEQPVLEQPVLGLLPWFAPWVLPLVPRLLMGLVSPVQLPEPWVERWVERWVEPQAVAVVRRPAGGFGACSF